MKIQLIAVGTKMPAWVTARFEEYQRRFPKEMPFELIEIPAGKRGKNADIKRILDQEGKAMLAACGKGKLLPWIFRVSLGLRSNWRNNWKLGKMTGAICVY